MGKQTRRGPAAIAKKIDVEGLTAVMKAMRESGVALVEFEGMKIALSPEPRPAATAASAIRQPTIEEAMAAAAKARAADREYRAEQAVRTRTRAASGIGPMSPLQAVENIYKGVSKQAKPASAPAGRNEGA